MELELGAGVETRTLPVDGGSVACTLDARAAAGSPDLDRHIVLCIDASKSMNFGSRIVKAREGIADAADAVGAGATVSVVTFADEARVDLPPTRVGEDEAAVSDAVESVTARGSTNIMAGLERSRELLAASDADVRWIVLVTDGHPSGEGTDVDVVEELEPHLEFAETLGSEGISVHAAGVGEHYGEALVHGVSERSGGRWEHVTEAAGLVEFFRSVAGAAAEVVAVNPRLRVEPGDGVAVDALYQRHPQIQPFADRPDAPGEPFEVGLPDLLADGHQRLALELGVPPGEDGSDLRLATCSLSAGDADATATVAGTYGPAALAERDESVRAAVDGARAIATGVDDDPEEAQAFLAARREEYDDPDALAAAEDAVAGIAESGDDAAEREAKADAATPLLAGSAPDDPVTDDRPEPSVSVEPFQPVAGQTVTVRVRLRDGTRVDGAALEWDEGAATTDEMGIARLSFDAPGEHTLAVSVPGDDHADARLSVEVAER